MKSLMYRLILAYLMFLGTSCEDKSFEDKSEDQAVTEQPEPGGTDDSKPVEDIGDRDDEAKSFIDYCLDEPEDDGLKRTIAAVKSLFPNEKLCGVLSSDLEGLAELDLSNRGLTDLRPLRRIGATRILLNGNLISDLTPLKTVKRAVTIDLSYNPINDAKPLEQIASLKNLTMTGTGVDVRTLQGIDQLRELTLRSNDELEDISGLSSLSNLTLLDLSNTAVVDLGSLSSLSSLKELMINGCPVLSLAPLTNISSLENLQVMGIPLADDAAATRDESTCPTNGQSTVVNEICSGIIASSL